MEMVLVDEWRAGGGTISWEQDQLHYETEVFIKKKTFNFNFVFICHFVFGSHQSKALLCMHRAPPATHNSNTYLQTLTLEYFDEYRSVHALYTCAGRKREPPQFRSEHPSWMWSSRGAAATVHQIYIRLWSTIIWRYIKGIYSPGMAVRRKSCEGQGGVWHHDSYATIKGFSTP